MYSGSCHCGQIKFDVDGEFEHVIECNCSHCSRKGYLLWFVPRIDLHVKSPVSELSVYEFNKHVIKHFFCPTCGCAPFGFGVSPAGTEMAAINARCLEGLEFFTLKRVQFDGRSM